MDANSIGTWLTIYTLTSYIAVVTNAGLLMFTINIWPYYTSATKVWMFYVFQMVLFGGMYTVSVMVDDVPPDVRIQLKRCEQIVNKVILLCDTTT